VTINIHKEKCIYVKSEKLLTQTANTQYRDKKKKKERRKDNNKGLPV
jgi:hypothetical protein